MPPTPEESDQQQLDKVDQESQVEQDAARIALETQVGEGLADVFRDEPSDPPVDAEVDPVIEAETDVEADPDTDKDVEGDDVAPEPTQAEIDEEAAIEGGSNTSQVPTLPDAHRRSLKAYQWTDEDIDKNLEVLGSQFLTTAAMLHANRNEELTRYADVGRQHRSQGELPPSTPNTGQTVPQAGLKPLQPVDVKALSDEYGDETLVEALAGPVNNTIAAINAIIPSLTAGQEAAQHAETDRVMRDVDTFFDGAEIAPYAEFYGDAKKGLTGPQIENRNLVLERAFDLTTGAATLRHQNLPLGDALGMAHGMISQDVQIAAVRKGITKTAKRRGKSVSLKPSKSTPLAPVSGERTRAQLEEQVAIGLQNVFGGA